ncbi:MAG: PorT family protein [Gemmatimonadetes bacterium]|nr:PorT family protein [Gemmatimonadota bacterium]MYE70649.1 PorT family protein [Gemmatimonadota bacterium]MYJ69495.1 PorT family protein [Gemmatimonadota bacterium]
MNGRLAILAALLCATPLTAQTTIGGRAGMTLSQFATTDEEVEPSSIAGIHFAVTASRMRGGVGIALSAGYTERGTGFTADALPGDVDFSFRLGYIDVAALGKASLGTGPYLLAGPGLSVMVSCTASVSSEGSSLSSDCGANQEDPFKILDFGVSGGAGMSFDVVDFHMVVEALYGFGILNISDVPDDSAMNRGLMIRVGADWVL